MGLMQYAARVVFGVLMAPPLVLVVEDEFLVRINAVSLLEEAGFGVLEAGSADEAIALLESSKGHPDRLYRHQHAWKHGRITTCARHP